MSSCGQDSRVFSASVNEVNKIDVPGDTKTAISHGGCYAMPDYLSFTNFFKRTEIWKIFPKSSFGNLFFGYKVFFEYCPMF
mgnify:CR=1 FL=1